MSALPHDAPAPARIQCVECSAWRTPDGYYWHRRTIKGQVYVNRDLHCKWCDNLNRKERYWRKKARNG